MKLDRMINLMWMAYTRNPVVIEDTEGLREAFDKWATLKIADGLEAEARKDRNIVRLDRAMMYKVDDEDGEVVYFCTDDVEEASEFCDTCERETESQEVIEYGRSEHYCVVCKGQK